MFYFTGKFTVTDLLRPSSVCEFHLYSLHGNCEVFVPQTEPGPRD